MYNYTICNQADASLFYRQCKALEDRIDGLQEKRFLEDVDGTAIREYTHPNGSVVVKNDCQVDALYVSSDFDLRRYFE